MEFFVIIILFYFIGLLINYLVTYGVHGLAKKVSEKLVNESKFLNELRDRYIDCKYIIYAISPDYVAARRFKGGNKQTKNKDPHEGESNEKKKIRLFIQISNCFNVILSVIIIALTYLFLKINFFSIIHNFICSAWYSFILMRTISRSVEIGYAFTKDVIKKEQKSTQLTSGERIVLGISSYIEVIINYSLVYYILSQFDKKFIFGDFSGYTELSNAIFRSIGISTFTGISAGTLDIFSVIQLFTSLALVYFAFASYIGNIDSKKEVTIPKLEGVKLDNEKKATETKKIKEHKEKDILFYIAIIVALGIVFTPIILKIPHVSDFVSEIILPLRQQGYKSSYFEVIGALVGSFLAITGAVWTQRRNDENKEREEAKYNARIIYNDLKSIEKYLDKEDESVNIRYFSDWQNVLAKCTFVMDDYVSYIYEIYDNVYNYNYQYKLNEKNEDVIKENIKEYLQLQKIFFHENNGCRILNEKYNSILNVLNNEESK